MDSALPKSPAVPLGPRRTPSALRRLPRLPLGLVKPTSWGSVAGPAVFAVVALALLVYDHVHSRVNNIIFWLSLALVVAIFLWLVARTSAAISREHRHALIDELTGLPNRRKLDADLALALGPEAHAQRMFVLVDIDGLSASEEHYSRAASDELLRTLARELADIAAALDGSAYRVDARAFAVLAASGTLPPSAIAAALTVPPPVHNDKRSIDISYGEVILPDEAHDPLLAFQIAGQRLATRKQRQHWSTRGQVRQVLMAVLAARRPELREQPPDVAYWIIAVSHQLGLDRDQLDDIVLAAELRDIGLLSVPEATLETNTALSDHERELIRRHPLVGERILNTAPTLAAVAPLVRAANEHFDGSGYPDGLTREDIPLGARIISACVEFAALTSLTRQLRTLSTAEALTELGRSAGTRFDPRVVQAIVSIAKEAAPSAGARGGPGGPQSSGPQSSAPTLPSAATLSRAASSSV